MSPPLCVRAPAKVNLVLHVGVRGAGGYHEVRTILQALALHDRIAIDALPSALELDCSDPRCGAGPENLAWRAADALRRAAGVRRGAAIRLFKRIPIEAGLGGGSSDAAAVLLGCDRLWGLAWPPERLAALAEGLGADVPFFLVGGTALGEGRGDRVRALPALPSWPVVLCHPGPGVPTPEAYRAVDALGARPAVDVDAALAACRRAAEGSAAGRRQVASAAANAFEPAVLPARPDIARLRGRLLAEGACAALLCGSGAAVFALAPSESWARAQARVLRREGLWSAATRFWPGRAGPVPRGG